MKTTAQLIKALTEVLHELHFLDVPGQHTVRQIAEIVLWSSSGEVDMRTMSDVNWGGNATYYDDVIACLTEHNNGGPSYDFATMLKRERNL